MKAIHFEAIVESGVIRIPDHFIKDIPTTVKVTLSPTEKPRIKMGIKSGSGMLSLEDYSALKINTQGWKFSREEANERH